MPRGRRRARLFILLAAGTVAAGALTAVVALSRNREGGGASPVVPTGASYSEAVVGTWQRVNPLIAATEVDRDLVALVFAGLVTLGPDATVRPGLADLPLVGENGRDLTFHLKPNLRWSDGAPLTSADVAFTIGLLRAPGFRGDPALAEAWSAVEVTAPDAETVILRLPYANAPFLARWATIGIVPRHVLEGASAQGLVDHPFNSRPIGAGPYIVRSLTSQEARLVPNPQYRGTEPAIGSLRLRFFSDHAAALRAFTGREVDGYLAAQPLTGQETAEIAERRPARLVELDRSVALIFYLNNDLTLFEDPSVRRSVALAIDRSALALYGHRAGAAETGSPVTPGTWAYAAEFDVHERNLQEARRLLLAAGWQPHPTTEVLTREGSEFRFTIRTDDDPVRLAVAAQVAEQLQALGIRASVVSTPFGVLLRDFLQERKYEAAIVAWDQGPDPDPYDGWHSSQMGSAGLNLANFSDPVSDELIGLGRTRYEGAVRADAYRQFQDRWQEMAPSVVLGYTSVTYVIAEDVRPRLPEVLFSLAGRFSAIEDWQR